MSPLQSAGRFLVRILDSIYPVPRALVVNRSLSKSADGGDRWPRLVEAARSSGTDLDPIAKDLFSDEIARLRRLEDKLAGHLQFLTPLLPLATGAAGVGLGKKDWLLFSLAAAVVFLLVSGFYMTTWGNRAVPLITVSTHELTGSGSEELTPSQRVLAVRLYGVEQNALRGIQLNNAIFACQRCLFSAVVLLSLAAGQLTRLLIG